MAATESMKRRIVASLGSKDAEPYNRALDAIAAMDAKIVSLQAELEHHRQIVEIQQKALKVIADECTMFVWGSVASKALDAAQEVKPLWQENQYLRQIVKTIREYDKRRGQCIICGGSMWSYNSDRSPEWSEHHLPECSMAQLDAAGTFNAD